MDASEKIGGIFMVVLAPGIGHEWELCDAVFYILLGDEACGEACISHGGFAFCVNQITR